MILTKKRMETVDDEITERALGFIDQSHKSGKPFFMWFNTTAMHFRTHCAPKHAGRTGQGFYNDVMAAHDDHVGQLLNKLDDLGIANDTIVMYSTDNGPHFNAWPDGGITPFRSEKDTNWEGGWRVPCVMRWPGKFKAGTVLNDIVAHQDMLPTLLAAAGDPNVSQKLLKGYKVGDKTYTVHIDGFNVLPYLTGEEKESPRKNFFYISDDGDVLGVRMGDWKSHFDGAAGQATGVLGRTIREASLPEVRALAPRSLRAGSRKTRTPTATGALARFPSCTRCRRLWRNRSRISLSIRRVRSQRHSTSTRLCTNWLKRKRPCRLARRLPQKPVRRVARRPAKTAQQEHALAGD